MKVLIIEDDIIWQLKLKMILNDLPESQIDIAGSLAEAHSYLENNVPDIVLADVVLANGLVFELFNRTPLQCPVIFLTGYPENTYMQHALAIPNTAFLVKPFHPLTLIGMIQSLTQSLEDDTKTDGIHISGRWYKHKIFLPFRELIYLEADGNYVHIHTAERNHTIKRSLRSILSELDQRFIQVHKAFVVNIHYINRVELSARQIIVNKNPIQLGRNFQQELLARLDK